MRVPGLVLLLPRNISSHLALLPQQETGANTRHAAQFAFAVSIIVRMSWRVTLSPGVFCASTFCLRLRSPSRRLQLPPCQPARHLFVDYLMSGLSPNARLCATIVQAPEIQPVSRETL